MENVGQKLSLVDNFFAFGSHPGHLTLSLHLRVDEAADVVPSIWPFEFSVALNLRVFQISTVNIDFFTFNRFVREIGLLIILNFFPFFISFPVHKISTVKESLDFDCAIVGAFGALATHLVLFPRAVVFRLITCLFEFPLTMEHSDKKLTSVRATIWENFLTITIRLITFKLPFVNGAIRKLQRALPLLLTVLPLTSIRRSIRPLTHSHSIHLSILPLAVILPSLLFAYK